MKRMRAALFVFAVFSLVVGLRSEDEVSAQIHHQWRRGFIGKFTITPDQPILDGWRLTVTFSKPIRRLEVWKATVVSKNKEKTEFVLENQKWNANLREGETYKFNFKGRKDGKGKEPSIDVSFESLHVGEGSGF